MRSNRVGYGIAGGAVSFAIFDDRVEVWSPGLLPRGITAKALKRKHPSRPRNPYIADVFFRAGLIERWGRGTNRVVEMCRKHGIAAPTFEEIADSVLVTFHVKVGTTRVTEQVTVQVTDQVAAVLDAARTPRSRAQLQQVAGIASRPHFGTVYLAPLLGDGWLEMTIPDKPNSRLQRYRTTEAGLRALAERRS